jgi:hypothetical protein
VVPLLFFSGCSSPNTVNVELRKQIDDLSAKVEDLSRRHDADQATIAGLKSNATTVPSLSEDRLAQLFTTHGVKFGRLTAVEDQTLKVYVCPIDDHGQALKAAGSFEVDAFDLSQSGETRLGHWTFDATKARDAWYGDAMLYTYVLKCPLEKPPASLGLTIRVAFTDALTGRKFTAQREVEVRKSESITQKP